MYIFLTKSTLVFSNPNDLGRGRQKKDSSVTYPAIWGCHYISHGRCGVSYWRCGCECGGCASLKEMIHLQWETTASPEGDAVSPERDLLASPNFGICDTTQKGNIIRVI
jgi:hypothetical protein